MCSLESPLQFYVNHGNSPSVTAYGPGLSYGIANKTATFTVFTEDAYEGVHIAIVEHLALKPSKPPLKRIVSCLETIFKWRKAGKWINHSFKPIRLYVKCIGLKSVTLMDAYLHIVN